MKNLNTYIKEQDLKHIIFDFDETISTLHIDWNPWFEDMNELFLSYDPSFSYKTFPELLVKQTKYIQKFGKEIVDKIIEINYQNEKKYYTGQTPNNAIVSFIKENFNVYRFYVWTSNDRRTILPAMKKLEINDCFEKIITRNDVTFIKPDPEGFHKMAIKEVNLKQILMVGDSFADEKAANSAGIHFVNVNAFL